MDKTAMQAALGKLKADHRSFGLMIGELDVAVQTLDGDALVNAIDDITLRYNCPVV